MPKKKSKRSKNGEVESLSQPCCVLGCDRFGTRLLSSLRDHYEQKENPSGRVCEGHYRRDLRKFKKRQALLQQMATGAKKESINNNWATNLINNQNFSQLFKKEENLSFHSSQNKKEDKICNQQETNKFRIFCEFVLKRESVI